VRRPARMKTGSRLPCAGGWLRICTPTTMPRAARQRASGGSRSLPVAPGVGRSARSAHRMDRQGALPVDVYSSHGNRSARGGTANRQPSPARATPAHSMPSSPRAPRSSHDACPHLRNDRANGSNPLVGVNEAPFGRGFVVR
jgi:hypothetical protein